jgi:hypothetical protein
MRFWMREVAGWLLVGLGLYLFAICLSLVLERPNSKIFETGPVTLIGIIVFRGGIHLLKVAMAARICLDVHAQSHERTTARPQEDRTRW